MSHRKLTLDIAYPILERKIAFIPQNKDETYAITNAPCKMAVCLVHDRTRWAVPLCTGAACTSC